MNPLIQAMKELGGSGSIEEINDKTAEIMGLRDQQLEILHDSKKGGRTEFEYRIAWSRTYLKKYGILENSSRGVWALTADGNNLSRLDEKEVKRTVRAQNKPAAQEITEEEIQQETAPTWREQLLDVLLNVTSAAFERLAQRILRESGFTQVEVTGRSGDGGIDGKGIMRLSGLLSFHVIFQCKRWQGSISPANVRDFRGAMVGRADKGLFITTGTFSKDAIREATRDGAPPIDLVDGEQLLDKLKELELGVKTRKVEIEEVSIDKTWFSAL